MSKFANQRVKVHEVTGASGSITVYPQKEGAHYHFIGTGDAHLNIYLDATYTPVVGDRVYITVERKSVGTSDGKAGTFRFASWGDLKYHGKYLWASAGAVERMPWEDARYVLTYVANLESSGSPGWLVNCDRTASDDNMAAINQLAPVTRPVKSGESTFRISAVHQVAGEWVMGGRDIGSTAGCIFKGLPEQGTWNKETDGTNLAEEVTSFAGDDSILLATVKQASASANLISKSVDSGANWTIKAVASVSDTELSTRVVGHSSYGFWVGHGNIVYYSANGDSWATSLDTGSHPISGICYRRSGVNNKLLACTSDGYVYTYSGSWAVELSGIASTLVDIQFHPDTQDRETAVVCGSAGYVRTRDSVGWGVVTIPGTPDVKSCCFFGDLLVAVAVDKYIATKLNLYVSPDQGSTWFLRQCPRIRFGYTIGQTLPYIQEHLGCLTMVGGWESERAGFYATPCRADKWSRVV